MAYSYIPLPGAPHVLVKETGGVTMWKALGANPYVTMRAEDIEHLQQDPEKLSIYADLVSQRSRLRPLL